LPISHPPPHADAQTLNSSFSEIASMPVMNYLLVYHFFGGLWTVQFIQGFAVMVIAGAVAAWYFSHDPGTKPASLYNLERLPVWASFKRTLRFSMGTIAFGALLIAILQFIRAVMAYVQRKLKESGQDKGFLKFAMCCINCCLWIIQKCVELITKNAFIYSAIKGTSFCASGRAVFTIIVNNVSALLAVNILGEIMMFLGKVLIAAACAWVGYAILDNTAQFKQGGENEIQSTWLIILVILFFSYAIASGFMMVFDTCVDTVLIAFVVDKTENGHPIHSDGSKLNKLAADAREDALKGVGGGKADDGAGAGVQMAPMTSGAPVSYENPTRSAPPRVA
ncbi:MAG: choline transporter-like family protein, partial [Achromobacter sp.]|uniref:choline transporter-like family protein n=1 Tax=Achromobacter sp. TaxID=134375 RepID=UPI0025836F27